jgi:cytochrome b561
LQPVSTDAARYDRRTMIFHWATAILVAVQWLGAQTIDWFPRGALRADAKSMHITGGLLLTAILVARVGWRLTRGRRLPLADRGLLNVLAKGTHWALYALLAVMVVAGMTIVAYEGENIFNLFHTPGIAEGNHELGDRLEDFHGTIGWIILAVAGFHASAALVHRYVWHDGVLGRMLPPPKGQRD